jgi:hypothetical protein
MSDRYEEPLSSGEAVEVVARLIEQSSLGTVGARQLRDRTDSRVTARIRAHAYFTATAEDERWWQQNKNDPAVLYAAALARVEGDRDEREVSRVLLRLAAALGYAEAQAWVSLGLSSGRWVI